MNSVLDASVVMALLNKEPGADRAAQVLRGARISAVNFAEVATKLAECGADATDIDDVKRGLDLRVEAFDEVQAAETGLLRPKTARWGLSLGDRACLALARSRGLPAFTADRIWSQVEIGVDIQLIR